MIRFVLRRLAWVLPNLIVLTFLLFAAVTQWLGSPAGMMLGIDASPESIAEINERYGFDEPVLTQYLNWMGNALTGDFGRSYITRQSVSEMIAAAMPVTAELGGWSMLVAVLLCLAVNSLVVGKWAVGAVTLLVCIIGVTVPNFLLGATLISFFSVNLGWLPTSGWAPWSQGFGTHMTHMIMPVATLATFYFSAFTMIYRAEYASVRQQLFVRVAEAKGLRNTRISFVHILPNAVLPLVTYIGTSMGGLVGGAVITETLFSMPGVGRLFVTAVAGSDFPVMLAMGMITLTGVMVLNLLAELILAAINPQVRV